MNYLAPPTTDIDNPPPILGAIGRMARGYARIFAESRHADALSPVRPVRRVGFDLRLDVVDSVAEAEGIRMITLARPDGSALPRWSPGAHIDVFTPTGRQRHYSLTGDPDDRRHYRIAVRRIPDGLGSAEMHLLRAGDSLHIRGPRNAFPFAPGPSCRFVAGGIGITPILPMVRAAARLGIDFSVVYTGRTRASMPFVDELLGIDSHRVRIHADDEHDGPLDIAEILGDATTPVYLCGPSGMLDAARRLVLTEQPDRELHSERFSPPPVIDGAPFRIHFAGGGSVEVGADETALAAIRRVKPEVRYSCRQGFCGACRVKVLDGRVTHHDRVLIGDEKDDSMMICVSRATDDHVVVDL
ncbi:PDR/VanB family oxidoreductase [Gordonia sp. L191]|uniref:PDR/VanB family oxidoreductase n=1 Tax=Gordonia sp. L191 TaxID=2982699 RepID=UPI0024C06D63|nr:PDR/VanB family oxidoreductase [Gordonia sp. L191]WHU47809.1 PDR/VanB family oxidoreductase [Gordonia sp. L191]